MILLILKLCVYRENYLQRAIVYVDELFLPTSHKYAAHITRTLLQYGVSLSVNYKLLFV